MEVGEFLGPYPSGAPAIFIDTVARLGKRAGIIGGVGDDDFGLCLTERLNKDGVDCKYIIKNKQFSTGCAFVTYFKDGSRKFIYHIGNAAAGKVKMPENLDTKNTAFFHIMGCSLMADQEFGAEIVETMKVFKDGGAKISFDPNIRAELLKDEKSMNLVNEVMKETAVLLPGVDELLLITGQKTIDEAIACCFLNENLEIIALKQGAKGCTIYTREGSFSVGVYNVVVKDPTGAGDCFDGAFLCGLMDKKPLSEVAHLATAAASLNTAAFGPMEGDISPLNVENMMKGELV